MSCIFVKTYEKCLHLICIFQGHFKWVKGYNPSSNEQLVHATCQKFPPAATFSKPMSKFCLQNIVFNASIV